MKCEWHIGNDEATWWADTIFGPLSWCCDVCLKHVGKKDAEGKYIAIPAAERLAELHPNNGSETLRAVEIQEKPYDHGMRYEG